MKYKIILLAILCLDVTILLFQASQLSISTSEAVLLYKESSFLQLLIKSSLNLFGQNDFALRIVMIFFHLVSILLLYEISKKYLKSERNRLWLVIVFVLLPGVVSAALIVSHAGFIIFGLFLYAYAIQRYKERFVAILLLLYALIDGGFVYLFLGLALYNLFQKRKRDLFYSLFLIVISIYFYGMKISGIPSGHFLDTLGVYSAIFTPVIFIYLFYSLYRAYLNDESDPLWYIASTALLFSLLLSFRQRVELEILAPYVMLSLPLAARTFAHSYRVRLKEYRKFYKGIFIVTFIFLMINTLVVLFNKELYLILDNPKQHFAYKMHIAKELANKLKKMGIYCVLTNEDMQLRLKFYNVDRCNENILNEMKTSFNEKSNVTIRYKNKILYKANVTKLNKK